MLTGKEECSRCGHLRAVHGAPRDRRGLGCIATNKTGGGRLACNCRAFVLYDDSDEFLTPSNDPVLTIEALQAVTLPLLGEEELPSVLPGVEDSSLALGDRVLFRTPLVRRRTVEDDPAQEVVGDYSYKRRIHRRDWVRGEATMWRVGYIIGKRTLQNGRYDHGGYDEQAHLYDISYLTAYLIAYDLHQKPVRVLEDDIKRL